ncbi:hypothetical protein [Maribacter sp. ACAM166]|uniref:hypothetical protein n=1 Tax=Maribacter sp. ACAM166 TaxID=2508996 RepID=UPI0010FE0FEE|nr:hypothetical protein [Maribacter sp. ACAM166]TLP81845.1 hypothetical protein ES765_03965 [Maribacter sp. ACAM166]
MRKETLHDPRQHYEPKVALIGYEAVNGYNGQDKCYFSKHPIRKGKLGAGAPLTKDAVRDMLKLVDVDKNQFSFKGLLPRKLLYFKEKGTLQLVWCCNRKTERLLFKDGLEISTGDYPIPKLLFSLFGESLSVYGLLRKKPIHERSELYHAPFMNTYITGNVCMGNATLDYGHLGFYEDIMAFAEQQFFQSVFTHTNHNHLLNGNYVELMPQMLEKQNFDETLLIPNHKTINDIYEN